MAKVNFELSARLHKWLESYCREVSMTRREVLNDAVQRYSESATAQLELERARISRLETKVWIMKERMEKLDGVVRE